MPDAPATYGHPGSGAAGLDSFGFDSAADEWLDRLRDAESPLPFGGLGAFERIEEVSRGGQGVVYRAVQPGTRRPTALKRLLGGPLAGAAMRRRFEREAEVLASLKHPNIVTAFAMDLVDGVPVLAMEWVEGISITAWAEHGGGRRGDREVAGMFTKVCDAVHHAHQRGVIHRDLKPSNILIDAAGEPHVLDFGLAKLVTPDGSGERSTSVTEHFVGTLKYASPEQVCGKPDALDVRTDVYSLGVILYETAAGRLPYDFGETWASAARAIELTEPLPLVRDQAPVNRDFAEIAFKALAKSPRDRYQSVDALAADLRRFLAGDVVTARTLSAPARWLRTLRRHRVAAAFMATIFVIVTAFAVAATVLAARLAEQRDLALAAQRSEAEARHGIEYQEQAGRLASVFLSQLLAPDESLIGPRATVNLKDLLAQAEPRIASDLFSQPGAEATVRVTLGRAYKRLRMPEEAEAQFEAALSLLRSGPAPDEPQLFTTLSELATLWHAKGDNAPGIVSGEDLLAMYRRLLEQGRAPTYPDLTALDAYLSRKGDGAGITALYRDTLEAHRRIYGEEHLAVLDDKLTMAFRLGSIGQDEEAKSLLHEALAGQRRLLGEAHLVVAGTLRDMGKYFLMQEDFASAEAYYQEAKAVYQRALGDGLPIVAELLYDLGLLHRKMGRTDSEAAYLRQALEIYRQALSEEHRDVGFCRWRLGQTLLDQDRFEEAEFQLRAALVTFERIYPQDHWRIGQTRSEVGECLTGAGRYAEAEPLLLDGYETLCIQRGQTHAETLRAGERLEKFYQTVGQSSPNR